ncbi:glycosyltransferase family 15 protein [Roridomyces roridus]|uniref:Glycosyltransferase family 15 protein n=1 Tax=Roridomyces roridus TaxID=1738132 RepID=A0AAD7BSL3_9AGAR|nr:glycosyltransferase family 15 protein [Roridomyces roridus]
MPRRRSIYAVGMLAIVLVLVVWYRDLFKSLLQGPLIPISEPTPPRKSIPEKYYTVGNASQRASAAIVILARNRELPDVIHSLTQFEDKFNARFQYPYVFLNEEPFTEVFKRSIHALTSASVHFGLIPREDWFQPEWIDEERASAARKRMKADGVLYGDSISYRNMCRFQSGFFFRHELLKPYKYYWRVEPDVQFSCDIEFDPFLFMQGEDKQYGFTMALYEYKKTIQTLWLHVQRFMESNPTLISPDNALGMLTYPRTGTAFYNLCHFWSNFEIASLDLWRSGAYMKFFEYLDSTGGFYYERWGDAPIHTIGAALFARKDQIHFFDEIGYAHRPYEHCPHGSAHARGQCGCDPAQSFDAKEGSCLEWYDGLFA